MESSPPSNCKLSSSDTTLSAALEPNFLVDDLLDFSNGDNDDDDEATAAAAGTVAILAGSSPFIPHATASLPVSATAIQLNKEEVALHEEELSHGLCVPPDELVHQLEWLSSFNEDNFFCGGDAKLLSPTPSSSRGSSGPTRCKEVPIATRRPRDDFRSESPVSVLEHGGHAYVHHAHRASRIRKARTGGRVWSLDILKPILFENRLKASYENTSLLVTSCSLAYSEPLCSFLQPDDSERPYKKIKQGSASDAVMIDSALVRKCTHCLVQKTPQWRAGPLGPKTLCNACGVRYKSGRLVPEYRPAASPSFVDEIHSNSHRRILEMRRVKEVESSVKRHKSKVERGCRRDWESESCVATRAAEEEHACKETRRLEENSFCEDGSLCEEVEESGVASEDSSVHGKEDSIDSGNVSCEANITSNGTHVHEAAANDEMACKEKNMAENACACNMEGTYRGRLSLKQDANADMPTFITEPEVRKVDGRVQSDEEMKAVYVAEK